MLTPAHFGLPPKFASWRDNQLEAIEQIVNCDERFQLVCAPTGFGKSLVYMAAAMMSEQRTVVLTSTKGLQDQLEADFSSISRDCRGQTNYRCTEAHRYGVHGFVSVQEGPCHAGAPCAKKNEGCEYYDRLREAQKSNLVTTNYAMWMYDSAREEQRQLVYYRPVKMLILDEAHDAPDALSSFISARLSRDDVAAAKLAWPSLGEDQEAWKLWADEMFLALDQRIRLYAGSFKSGRGNAKMAREAMICKRVARKLERIAGMTGKWVIEEKEEWSGERKHRVVHFDPLWPQNYAESALFRQVPKVVMVSATVRPKTAGLLGVGLSDANFYEYPSGFPALYRPIIHVPTVRMNHWMSDQQTMLWLQRIDQILDGRKDRKGVIHSVSYDRMQLIKQNSRHSSRILTHDSKTRREVVEQFKRSTSPSILCSPSVDTGYDFPYEQCEFQIISKIPFLDKRAKVIRERDANDHPEFANYTTAQTLVQMTGRGMRAADDRCETLIIDNCVSNFVFENRKHIPKWWMDSFRVEVNVPSPLPKL